MTFYMYTDFPRLTVSQGGEAELWSRGALARHVASNGAGGGYSPPWRGGQPPPCGEILEILAPIG
jgi:hypothetical protein